MNQIEEFELELRVLCGLGRRLKTLLGDEPVYRPVLMTIEVVLALEKSEDILKKAGDVLGDERCGRLMSS